MAQYQKFMFDNFVISCEDEKCRAEPLPEVEAEGDVAEPEETLAEETPEVIEEPAAAEPEPETVPGYSQDELDAAVTAAEERGYEKGFNAAAGENEKRQAELLENVNNRLMTLLAENEKQSREAEQDALRFALELVKKLFPALEEKQAISEVQKFLQDNFAAFRHEESLSFSFNPAVVGTVAQSIGRLAEKNDFEGKISIHKDENLSLSECRVEWKNGGVERSAGQMLAKAEALLDKQKNINEERDNGE